MFTKNEQPISASSPSATDRAPAAGAGTEDAPRRRAPGALGQLSMLLALEPRFMFDAAVAAAAAEVADAANDAASGGEGDAADAGEGQDAWADGGEGEGGGGFGDDGEGLAGQPHSVFASPLDGPILLADEPLGDSQPPTIGFNQPSDFSRFEAAEDTPIRITGISVGDPDNDPLQVVVTVEHGWLSGFKNVDGVEVVLQGTSGVDEESSVEHANGKGYTKLVVKGHWQGINTFLESLYYQADQDWNSEEGHENGETCDTLTVRVLESEPGKQTHGQGPTELSVDIFVAAVNDAPVIEGFPEEGKAWTVNEDEPLPFYDETENTFLFTVKDPDIGDTINATFTVNMGGLLVGETDLKDMGYDYVTFVKNGDGGTYTITGRTTEQLNDLIKTLCYQGAQDKSGGDTLTVTLSDGAATGSFQADILISPVDDPPIYNPGASAHLQVTENGHAVFTESNLAITDIDTGPKQISLTIKGAPTHGVLQMLVNGKWIDLGKGATFSYLDIIGDGSEGSNRIRYLHTGGQVCDAVFPGSESDSFVLFLDGVDPENGNLITLTVNLTPVNDAPTLGDIDATVYEGEHGAPIIFDIIDPDQDDATTPQKIAITGLPADGELYYFDPAGEYGKDYDLDADNNKIPLLITADNMANLELSLTVIKAGGLTYVHNGKDGAALDDADYQGNTGSYPKGATRPDGFTIKVTDDGGGSGVPIETGNMTIVIDVLPNNDMPTFENGLHEFDGRYPGYENVVGEVTVYRDSETSNMSSGDVKITADMLKVRDDDSSDSCITFTVKEPFASGKGGLYFRYEITDPLTNEVSYRYRAIGENDSFTLADVKTGLVVYRYCGNNAPTSSANFLAAVGLVVKDGSKSVIDPYGRRTGGIEGCVGDYVGDHVDANWQPTVVRLAVSVDVSFGEGGTTIDDPITMGEEKIEFTGDKAANVYEGGKVFLSQTDLNAMIGYYDEGDQFVDYVDKSGATVTGPVTDPSLVYRVEKVFEHGKLYLRTYLLDDDGQKIADAGFEGGFQYVDGELGLYDSFLQSDVANIYYLHDGSETLSDSMEFSISNGRIFLGGDQPAKQTFAINVLPVNDTPSVSGSLTVREGPTAEQVTSGEEGFGTLGELLDETVLAFVDADGGGTGYAATNDLSFVIVGRPANGGVFRYIGGDNGDRTLRSNWVEIQYASAAQAQNHDWSGLPAGTVLTMADLTGKNIRYIHNGSETYTDSISIVVNDGKGVPYGGGPAETAYNGNGNTQDNIIEGEHGSSVSEIHEIAVKITPVNDAPRFEPGSEADEKLTVPFGQAGKQRPGDFTAEQLAAMLIGKQDDGKGQLKFSDADHDTDQIMYRIVESTRFGTIFLQVNKGGSWVWEAQGVGGEFTQADIDAGRVCYIHAGDEAHIDSFKFSVSDKDKSSNGSYLTENNPDVRTYDIAITPENAAPVIEKSGGATNYYLDSEDGLDLSGRFTVSDPDYSAIDGSTDDGGVGSGVATDIMQVTVEVKNGDDHWGTLVFADSFDLSANGVTLVSTETGKLVIKGKLADVNRALGAEGGLRLMPGVYDENNKLSVEDLNGKVTLTITANDLANGDAAGAKELESKVEQIDIMVSPVNDAPEASAHFDIRLTEDDKNVSVSIPNADSQQSVYLAFTDVDDFGRNVNKLVLTVAHGTLNISKSGQGFQLYNVTGYNTGTLTLYGTREAINAALKTLTYTPNAEYSGDRSTRADRLDATYQDSYGGANDECGTGGGGLKSCTTYVDIYIDPVNDDPTVTTGEQPVVVGSDPQNTYPVLSLDGQTPIQVGDIDITGGGYKNADRIEVVVSIRDKDGVAISDNSWGTLESAYTHAGVTVTQDGPKITISGTLEQVNKALAALAYRPPTHANPIEGGELQLKIEVQDYDNGSASADITNPGTADATVTMIINQDNAAPTITVDKDNATTTTEDPEQGIVFKIEIDDAEKRLMELINHEMTVKLKVDNGTLTFPNRNTGNVTFTTDGDYTVITGMLDEINKAIAGLTYMPNTNYYGSDTLTIIANDNGCPNIANGDPESLTKTIDITVTPINDLPVVQAPAKVTVDEDRAYIFNKTGNLITVSDVEYTLGQNTNDLTLKVWVDNGSLNFNGPGITVGEQSETINGETRLVYSLEGSPAELAAALKTLQYTPDRHWNGAATLHLAATDADGGPTEKTVGITVKPVNDAPVVDGGADLTVNLTGNNASPEIQDSANPVYKVHTVGDMITGSNYGGRDFFSDPYDAASGTGNSLLGVVITGTNVPAGSGHWEYSLDGSAWTAFPAGLSDTKALYLAASAQVRFVPTQNYNTVDGQAAMPSLTVRLADDSTAYGSYNPAAPASGKTDNLGSGIGQGDNNTSRYSDNTITFVQAITPKNDAPQVTKPNGTIVVGDDSGTAYPVTDGKGGYIQVGDIDITGVSKGQDVIRVTVAIVNNGVAATDDAWGSLDFTDVSGVTTIQTAGHTFTIEGTLDAVNNALETLTYTPPDGLENSLDLSLRVTADDRDNGSPTPDADNGLTTSLDVPLIVNATNDPPAIEVHDDNVAIVTVEDPANANETLSGVVIDEDGSIALEGVFRINDPEAAIMAELGLPLIVTVTVDHGTIRLDTSSLANGQWNYNAGTKTYTLTAGQDAINAVLATLSYEAQPDWNGKAVITVTAADNDVSSLEGLAKSDSLHFVVDVVPVNDAPVVAGGNDLTVTLTSVNQEYQSDDTPSYEQYEVSELFNSHFSDPRDAASAAGANGFAGVLVVGTNAPAEAGVWKYSLDGVNWLAFDTNLTGTHGQYLPADRHIRFEHAAGHSKFDATLSVRLVDDSTPYNGYNPAAPVAGGTVDLDASVNDDNGTGRYSKNTITISQHVAPVNEAPSLNQDNLAVEINIDSLWHSLAGLVVDDNDISSPTGYGADEMRVTVTLNTANGDPITDETYGRLRSGGQSGSTLTFTDTRAKINDALADLSYQAGTAVSSDTTIVITVTVDDLDNGSPNDIRNENNGLVTQGTITLTILKQNNPPSIDYTGSGQDAQTPITVDEDTPLAFDGGNAISFADPDIDLQSDKQVTVTLEVDNGILTLGDATDITGYPTNGGSTLELTGTLKAINDAIATLHYQGDQDYFGTDELRITINDEGNVGQGNKLTDEKTIHIDVQPIPDDPIGDDQQSAITLDAGNNGSASGNLLDGAYDPDGTEVTITNTDAVSSKHGTLTVDANGDYTFVVNPDNADIAALGPGQSISETIFFTIADENQGSIVKELTLTITKPVPTPPKPPAPPTPPPGNNSGGNTSGNGSDTNTDEVAPPSAPTYGRDTGGSTGSGGSSVGARPPLGDPVTPVHDSVTSGNNAGGPVLGSIDSSRPDPFAAANRDAISHNLQPDRDFLYDVERMTLSDLIILHARPDHRNTYINHIQELIMPEGMFRHSLPGKPLFHHAMMEDGSPLEDWMEFDDGQVCFRCTPPPDAKGAYNVRILARDAAGNLATTTLTIMVREPEEMPEDNGFRDPDQIALLGGGEGEGDEGTEEETEGAVEDGVETDAEPSPEKAGADDDLDGEIAALLESVAEPHTAGPDQDFSRSVCRAGNSGLWTRSLELLEAAMES